MTPAEPYVLRRRRIHSHATEYLKQFHGYIPQAVLRHAFSTGTRNAMRNCEPETALWRPLAELVLGESLVIRVDPKRLVGLLPEFIQGRNGRLIDTKMWFVLGGEWDICPIQMYQHETFKRMKDLVESDDISQSPSYRELEALRSADRLPSRIAKLGDGTVDGYFNNYRLLADKIRAARAIPNFGARDKDRYVGVAVGRNGELLHHQKGHHRAILAQLISCDTMDARVLAVHPLWLRDLMLGAGLAPGDAIHSGLARLRTEVDRK